MWGEEEEVEEEEEEEEEEKEEGGGGGERRRRGMWGVLERHRKKKGVVRSGHEIREHWKHSPLQSRAANSAPETEPNFFCAFARTVIQ